MTNTDYHEVKFLESIKQSVEARLTGQGESEVVDGEPARRFSIGILNASKPSDRAQGSTLRRPESVGFYVRLDKNSSCEGFRCQINFSLYYRIRPKFEEQTLRGTSELADDEQVVPVPKYRRIDKAVTGSRPLSATACLITFLTLSQTSCGSSSASPPVANLIWYSS